MFLKVQLSGLGLGLGSRFEAERSKMAEERQRNKCWGPKSKFCLFLHVVCRSFSAVSLPPLPFHGPGS